MPEQEAPPAPDREVQDQSVSESAPEQDSGTSAAEQEERFTDLDLDETPDDEITPDFLKSRYEQMQADYTKKTQGLAEQRRAFESIGLNDDWIRAYENPDTRDEAVKWFLEREGIVLADEEPDDDGVEDGEEGQEFRDPRVDELISEREQEQAQALVDDIQGHLSELASKAELDLPDRWLRALTRDALEAGAQPDKTERIFEEWASDLKQYGEKAVDAYRGSKDGQQPPPRRSGSGTPEIDVTDPAQRLKRLTEVANEHYS